MANRINYNKTIDQADDIKDLAKDLGAEIEELQTLLSNVKNEWKGPASDAFQKQLKMLITDMKATKESMSDVASDIKSAAKQIQREDEEKEASISGSGGGGGGSF